jgi:spore coat polysaccharide biosynthesis protein SpsF (cytidylyltransferase family)
VERLRESGIKLFIAVPEDEKDRYAKGLELLIDRKNVILFPGHPTDCLRRTLDCAEHYDIDTVIRVTHDKIFVDQRQINFFVEKMIEHGLEYIYSTNFIDGMSFEIFKRDALKRAAAEFKDVEHISFAIDAVTTHKLNLNYFPYNKDWMNRKAPGEYLRLLVDYPNDFIQLEAIMNRLGVDCEIEKVVENLKTLPCHNRQPLLTVYTCSYDDLDFVHETIPSVLFQNFDDFEYLLIDDGSEIYPVTQHFQSYTYDTRVKVLRNPVNVGLASSSNLALKEARGKFIIRLDADDYFWDPDTLGTMLKEIRNLHCDILYPDNHQGSRIQKGYEKHHVGGTLFRKRALDFIKFTDGLRHFEGQDIYKRALGLKLKVNYWHHPAFFYRQRPNSLSKSKDKQRKEIERKLARGETGEKLL